MLICITIAVEIYDQKTYDWLLFKKNGSAFIRKKFIRGKEQISEVLQKYLEMFSDRKFSPDMLEPFFNSKQNGIIYHIPNAKKDEHHQLLITAKIDENYVNLVEILLGDKNDK